MHEWGRYKIFLQFQYTIKLGMRQGFFPYIEISSLGIAFKLNLNLADVIISGISIIWTFIILDSSSVPKMSPLKRKVIKDILWISFGSNSNLLDVFFQSVTQAYSEKENATSHLWSTWIWNGWQPFIGSQKIDFLLIRIEQVKTNVSQLQSATVLLPVPWSSILEPWHVALYHQTHVANKISYTP